MRQERRRRELRSSAASSRRQSRPQLQCVSKVSINFDVGDILNSWPIQAPAAMPPIPAAASMAVEWPLSFFSLLGSAGAPGAVL